MLLSIQNFLIFFKHLVAEHCTGITCGKFSKCVSTEDSHACVCEPGYTEKNNVCICE